jgi:hypothetical protein
MEKVNKWVFNLDQVFHENVYKKILILLKNSILKGPNREMFFAGIFTEIRPVWAGDLETRPINQKVYVWGLILPFISWDFSILPI